jgi:MoxR-like ATPase
MAPPDRDSPPPSPSDPDPSALRMRIDRFRLALGRHFVDKQPIIDLMTVCAVAQEPLLLVGPPGTAKSELAVKFQEALSLGPGDYFEYALTRFTEPSELFGPMDLDALRAGRFLRRVQGKLPTARVAFLDEIFQSNSAILNSLLTLLQERKFYQDGEAVPSRLRVLFAATNEIPDPGDLVALTDRFPLKIACNPVADARFLDLIDSGLASQSARDLGQRPWVEGHATLDDFEAAHRHLASQFAWRGESADGAPLRDRDRFFPEPLLKELSRLLRTLTREDGLVVSDRKVVKLYRLLRARAWLLHGGAVTRDDLRLVAYLGESQDELALLEEKVPRLLGLS